MLMRYIFLILHILKKEGMSRHTFACRRTAALRDYPVELVKGNSVPSNINKGADNRTHHVPQKTVCGNAEMPAVAGILHPDGFRNIAQCGLDIGMGLAERPEIADLKQMCCSFVHGFKVKWIMKFARIITKERVLTGMYIIMVCTLRRTETRMHIGSHRLNAKHRNVARQDSVQPISQLLTVGNAVELEMRHHFPCVHTSVGTPCTDNRHGTTQHFGQGILQLFLHGIAIGLYLPTVIIGAVVTKVYEESIHFQTFLSFVFHDGTTGDGTSPPHG